MLAEAAGNAFAAEHKSVVEGIFLAATILFWSYVPDWMALHLPVVERLLHATHGYSLKTGKCCVATCGQNL